MFIYNYADLVFCVIWIETRCHYEASMWLVFHQCMPLFHDGDLETFLWFPFIFFYFERKRLRL